jgi:four helix bundle protein
VAKIQTYRELIAWQKSYRLVLMVYRLSQHFPKEERFGLTQQIRRAAISVPSNIAEGWGRSSRMDYIRFLDMARGSIYELQTQMLLAGDLGFCRSDDEVHALICEVERLINALMRALRAKAS